MSPGELEEILRRVFDPVHLVVEDLSRLHASHAEARATGGGHYSVTIVSQRFSGRARLERHRMVHEALAAQLEGAIHALSIRALDPEEWKAAGWAK